LGHSLSPGVLSLVGQQDCFWLIFGTDYSTIKMRQIDLTRDPIFFLSLPLEVAIRSFAKWQQRSCLSCSARWR
jgi:hypothetical protein